MIDVWSVALTGVRIVVGLTLLVAGVIKLRSGQANFLRAVLGYDLVSGRPAATVARALPPAEIVTGVLLLGGLMVPLAGIAAFGLFLAFTCAIARSLIRGMKNDCGCYGRMQPVRWRLVYRNTLLMGGALATVTAGGGVATLDDFLSQPFALPADTTMGVSAALLVVWAITLASVPVLRWRESRTG